MSRDEPRPVVLLVDDSPADRALTRRSLEDSGIPVELRTVEDGEEALDYLRREGRYADPKLSPAPIAVLLDLNMPGMNGAELLGHIRADRGIRSLPVVVLTGSDLERDIQRSYDSGANAYMVKPLSADAFQAVIGQFLDFWVSSRHVRRPSLDQAEEGRDG